MDSSLIIVLFLATAGAVVGWALLSKRAVKKVMDDPNASKSTLAEDAPNK